MYEINDFKMKNLSLFLGCYKLVTLPWFEGSEHTFECVRTQTEDLVFFLKNKSETTKLIKRFIVLIKNQTNEKVNGIRCDNETEFKNAILDHFCVEKGIQHQYSATRTPQQNGVAERKIEP